MGLSRHDSWPVLTRYDAAHLRRVALPLGGIGTGTVSLGGRGDLRDWEVANRPAKGFTPARGFFALRTQTGDAVTTRALEGPIDPADYEGAHGSPVPNHGLPRFRNARFEVAYPLGQVVLDDADVPLQVRLQAFNPLLPTDARSSGIPGAVLRYVLHNPTDAPVTATVCGSLPNFIGNDGTATGGRNEFRSEGALRGVFCRSDEVDATAEQFGTMAISALAADGDEVSHRTAWLNANWGTSLLDFWDDLVEDGRLQDPERPEDQPTASLAVTRTVPAGESTEVTFLLTWHFPNRTVWEKHETPENTVGNYYGTVWADAWAVATELAERADELESRTVEFVSAVCSSDVPAPVLDAALSNISTLRTQTCFRTADGRFFGWEGCSDKEGSCFGNCTHVWNYEPATAHLFGDLARSMREIEFAYGTDENGLMSFRVQLPLDRNPREWALAAADGQMGCLIKLFREWRLSGDDEMLRALWPAARKALEFCWIPGGWDADQDGVMEGCQHDTMDVEFYGPNPQIGCWYLGALRAGSEMAGYLGEADFAAHCQDLFSRGSTWIDENLFNGQWYEQHIRPARSIEDIAPNLRLINVGAQDVTDPDLQIGPGCLTDQLVGDAAAQLSGLGALLDHDNATRALDSVVTYNRISGTQGHFNHMRTYVLGDETALLICTYPDGGRPKNPFPYAHEAWTGLEYSAAIGLLQHGRTEQAVEVVRDVRDRYDGWRRSPFDEAECGHHYARAMASWGVLLAFTGFGYEARTGRLQLRGQDGARWFFSTGNAWGTAVQRHSAGELTVEIEVHGGTLRLDSVQLTGLGSCQLAGSVTLTAGDTVTVTGARG